MRGISVVIAAVSLTATSGACGSGGGSATLGKREFSRRVDAICQRSNRAIGAVGPTDPTDPQTMLTAATKVVAMQRDEVRQLRRLPPPAPDRVVVDRWLGLIDQTLDASESLIEATRAEDGVAVDEWAKRARDLDAEARAVASSYGLRGCASPTS